MTITEFCLDHLTTHGPLPLPELAAAATAAGVTTSGTPETSVRTALRDRAVELDDGRWAAPLALLEGRCLTTRSLMPHEPSWYSDYAPEPARPNPWQEDLGLLLLALKGRRVPLAPGGHLKSAAYGGGLSHPKSWPGVMPEPDELLCLQVKEGALHVSSVSMTPAMARRGHELAVRLGPLRKKASRWAPLHETVGRTLAQLLATDAEALTEPVPPLSMCVPELRTHVEEEHARGHREWLERQPTWDVQLSLPAGLRRWAGEVAGCAGLSVEQWLEQEIICLLDAAPSPNVGEVVPFRFR